MMRTPLLIEISVMGFFFGKILCRGYAVVFFKNPVKIRNALETTGLADDRERIAALFHLVYGMTEAKLINIFFYGEGFCPPDSPVDIAFGHTAGFGDIPDGLKRCIVCVNIINDPLKTGSFILTDRNFIFQRILIAKSCQICKNLCKQQVGSGRFAAGSCVPVDELLSVILGNENNRCLETGQVGRYYGR